MEWNDGPMLATKWKQLPLRLEYDVLGIESMAHQSPAVSRQSSVVMKDKAWSL
jgi:hypothetical protein